MAYILSVIVEIIYQLLGLLIIALIINAVLSWLIAFDVVNLRNRYVRQLALLLDAISAPVLRPLRKVIPSLGGIDITPVIVIVVLSVVQAALKPFKLFM